MVFLELAQSVIEYRAYLQRGKLIVCLSEPVRDVTVDKQKHKVVTELPKANQPKAMTKSEIMQEILSM